MKRTGRDLTQEIIDCNSFKELKKVVEENAPFISHSRSTPVEWTAEIILTRINDVRNGAAINAMTRVNGLRAKVAELVLADNYGDPWK